MRSRSAITLVILLLLQSWAAVSLPEEARAHVDAWEEAPFRDVAVLEPFSHQTFADYSDVAIIINNQSEVSRTIGTAFALARNIPPERILLLTNESTPTSETINSNQFTTYFANPISQMISERNLTELNVLVTTKGTPLRVNGGTNSRASFDPDGKTIVMVTNQGNGDQIGVFSLPTGSLEILTNGRLDESPTFAPNGAMILYAAQRGGSGLLSAVSADGRVRQVLRSESGTVREPAWSPLNH